MLEADGNLTDACLLAMLVALSDTALPAVRFSTGEGEGEDGTARVVVVGSETAPLSLEHRVYGVSFGLLDGRLLLDPTAEEVEALLSTSGCSRPVEALSCEQAEEEVLLSTSFTLLLDSDARRLPWTAQAGRGAAGRGDGGGFVSRFAAPPDTPMPRPLATPTDTSTRPVPLAAACPSERPARLVLDPQSGLKPASKQARANILDRRWSWAARALLSTSGSPPTTLPKSRFIVTSRTMRNRPYPVLKCQAVLV